MSSEELESAIAVAYLLLGPAAWLLLAFVAIKGRKRMRLLNEPLPSLEPPLPRVSVLVPAKDEQHQIEQCIQSILQLDYPDLEIVAINDRSQDQTGAILNRLAGRDPRITAIHVREGELPRGWGGKNFALHCGVQVAKGSWLLFIDADVRLEPAALTAPLAVARYRSFDLISLLPRFEGRSFWEQLLQPLAGAATSAMFLIALTNSNFWPRTAFANGQFLLIRRAVYDHVGGHDAVRGTLSEDTALAQRVKVAGFRPRLAWGDAYTSVRMYDSLASIYHGWARNFYIGSRGRPTRIVLAMLFVIVASFSAYAAMAWGLYRAANPVEELSGRSWLLAGLGHWTIMSATLAMMYRWGRLPVWNALLFPVGGAVLLAIFLRSLIICVTGRVVWRGTSYTRAQLRLSQNRSA